MGAAWWAAWALVALSTLLLLLALVKIRPAAELTRTVHEIARDLDGLSEHVTRMETRQRVRKMREGKEQGVAALATPAEIKAALRARLRAGVAPNGGE